MLLLVLLTVVILAPALAPYDVSSITAVSPTNNQAPTWAHPMGTDGTDRDVFSRVLKGAQISLIIGAASVALALAFGTLYGATSAFLGGWADSALMRLTDVTLALPRFLILLAATSISATPLTPGQLILLIGFTGWFATARLTRAEVTALLSRDWLLAARASGIGNGRLAIRHIFPHLVPMLTVVATVSIGHTIVLEAALAFLGASSSGASLGTLLQHSGSSVFANWWLPVFPGLAIVLIVFACNALGDALRDVLSPEQLPAWPTP
ncbi:MAG: ABC transporter permease [Phycisphaerae bacterium]|nr:ABC transporter permease [Gemmatimonadaceae bacterium]